MKKENSLEKLYHYKPTGEIFSSENLGMLSIEKYHHKLQDVKYQDPNCLNGNQTTLFK